MRGGGEVIEVSAILSLLLLQSTHAAAANAFPANPIEQNDERVLCVSIKSAANEIESHQTVEMRRDKSL